MTPGARPIQAETARLSSPPAVWLGAALSALRAGRSRQAHVPDRRDAARRSACGSSSSSPSPPASTARDPAGRRRAARRAPAATARTACSRTCPISTRPTPASRRALRALRDAGHPVISCPRPASAPTSAALFLLAELAVAVAGWGCRSTPSTSPTCSRPRTRPTSVLARLRSRAARCRAVADADDEALARCCSATPRRRATSRSWPTLQPSDCVRRGRGRAARSDPRQHAADDHVRLRPALPALHRPVPQGRPEGRPLPAAAPRRQPPTSRSPARRLQLHDAQERPGDRRPEHAARARAAGRACASVGRRSGCRAACADHTESRRSL